MNISQLQTALKALLNTWGRGQWGTVSWCPGESVTLGTPLLLSIDNVANIFKKRSLKRGK